jgi:hypothetical protein
MKYYTPYHKVRSEKCKWTSIAYSYSLNNSCFDKELGHIFDNFYNVHGVFKWCPNLHLWCIEVEVFDFGQEMGYFKNGPLVKLSRAPF